MDTDDRYPNREYMPVTVSVEERRWREVRERLRRFVGRRVRNPADAEDVVQEAFVRMQSGVDKLSSAERLDAWRPGSPETRLPITIELRSAARHPATSR